MIDAIGGIIVMVSDQQKAVNFYVNKLGFEKKCDMQAGPIRWIEVAPKNSQTTISLMQPNPQMFSPEQLEKVKKRIGIETELWFYTKDIQATYDELISKGVEISKPEKQDWGGTMSAMKDQDGNSYALVSAPESMG